MAKLELTARVHFVGEVKQFPSKNDPSKVFTRRYLYLDTTTFDQYTGQRSQFEKFPAVEFNNKNSALLDNAKIEDIENAFSKVEPNDIVRVAIDLSGRFYDSQDGDMIPDYNGNVRPRKHFNSIEGYEITIVKKMGQSAVSTQQPQVAQPQAPAYPAQAAMPQQPMQPQYGMPQQPMMQPQQPYGYAPAPAGAPF